jgi:hypothetical protein
MSRYEASGGSCGVASGAWRGPLYNARRSVHDRVASLRDGIQCSWLEPMQADIQLRQQSAAILSGETVEARQREFETRASQIRSRAKNIAARSNELGQSTAAEMRALMDAVDTAPGKPGFSCYDPTLAQRLRQAADQAAAPAEMKLRAAVFTEGPAGVANAIKNLWAMCGRLRVVKEIERVAAWSRQPCVRPFDAVQHDRWPLCLPRIRSRSIPRI